MLHRWSFTAEFPHTLRAAYEHLGSTHEERGPWVPVSAVLGGRPGLSPCMLIHPHGAALSGRVSANRGTGEMLFWAEMSRETCQCPLVLIFCSQMVSASHERRLEEMGSRVFTVHTLFFDSRDLVGIIPVQMFSATVHRKRQKRNPLVRRVITLLDLLYNCTSLKYKTF